MSSENNNNALTDVLEFCEQKLPQGDYLKVANFLKDIHKNKPSAKIVKKIIKKKADIDIHIDFETFKNKKYNIHLQKYNKTIIIFQQSGPWVAPEHKAEYSGFFNGNAIQISDDDLIRKVIIILSLYGIKNIKRTFNGEEDTFKNLKDYKKHFMELHMSGIDCDYESDTEEDHQWDTDSYLRSLFCMDEDLFNIIEEDLEV